MKVILKLFLNKFISGAKRPFWAQKWRVFLTLDLSVTQWEKPSGTSNLYIVSRGFLTPLFHEDPSPLYCLRHFFKFCSSPPPQTHTHFLLLCFFGWMCDHATCFVLFNDIMDLNFLGLGTLVQAVPCYVFYATTHQIYWRCDTDGMVFAGTLIWDHTLRQTYTVHTRNWYTGTQIKIYIKTTCYVHTAVTCIKLNE